MKFKECGQWEIGTLRMYFLVRRRERFSLPCFFFATELGKRMKKRWESVFFPNSIPFSDSGRK